MIIPKSSIISSISLKAKKFPKEFQIECEDVHHITFKEIVELFLFAKGARKYEWIDKNGGVEKSSSFLVNCCRLCADIFLYPFKYIGFQISVVRIGKKIGRAHV